MKPEFKVPLSKPSIDQRELDAIKRVSEEGCLAGTCEEVRKFEEEFARFVGSRFAVATSSCTTALHVACMSLGIGHTDRVVVPAYTFPATAFAPMYCGARVQIVDVDRDTWNIDVSNIPKGGLFSSKSPDVIIPVHCFGNPANMDELCERAEDNGSWIIEDAACALPAHYKGKYCGTIGDVGCYSFYAIKNLCTGEGGMLVTDNEEVAATARLLVDFGKTSAGPLPQFTELGYNYRLSALQAAMGRVQLSKLGDMHAQRECVASRYNSFISDSFPDLVIPQEVLDGCSHAYQRYAVVLDSSYYRDSVMRDLAVLGVQTAIGTYDLSSQPVFKHIVCGYVRPVSDAIFNQSISLPMYPGLTREQVEYVCQSLEQVLVK